jgi:hypothetical protein
VGGRVADASLPEAFGGRGATVSRPDGLRVEANAYADASLPKALKSRPDGLRVEADASPTRPYLRGQILTKGHAEASATKLARTGLAKI